MGAIAIGMLGFGGEAATFAFWRAAQACLFVGATLMFAIVGAKMAAVFRGTMPMFAFGGTTMFAFGGATIVVFGGVSPTFAFGGGMMAFAGRGGAKKAPERVDIVEKGRRGAC